MKTTDIEAIYTGDLSYTSEEQTLAALDKRARICYRSEPGTTQPVRFIKALMRSGHGSTLEQSQLGIELQDQLALTHFVHALFESGRYRFLDLECLHTHNIIAGNLRMWVEAYSIIGDNQDHAEIFGRIKYMMPTLLDDWTVDSISHTPPELPPPIRRHGAYVKCDRGVMAEVTRHDMNFLVESTRYVGLSLAEDGRELEVIDMLPHGMSCPDPADEPKAYAIWHEACMHSSKAYSRLRKLTKPEIARQVLNTSLATRWYMAGLPSYWRHFFNLRNSPKAHPLCRYMAAKLEESMSANL